MSLGIYGDGGSMKGSGIDSVDYTGVFFCSNCDDEFECEGSTDDWQTTAYATCPKCETGLEKDIDTAGQDDDYAYDSWRDSQLD